MMFRLALISVLVGNAASLKANSALGRELLSRARRVEQDAVDYSWVMDYSIKFNSCHTITQYGAAVDGDEEGGVSTWKQNLVEFKLCPSDTCGYGCEGGDYIVNMADFVDLYTESRLASEELACETVRENCSCDDADDEDACEYTCYINAGLDYCIVDEDDEDAFNLQEYLECVEIEDQYGYGESYYTGLTCSENGQRINLGIFYDNMCSVAGPNQVFANYMGQTLPYAEETIVNEDCVNCSVNNGDGYELSEYCGTSYTSAAKCETDMSVSNPDYDGCEYINNIFMKEDGYIPRKSVIPLVCAWVFGVSTLVLAFVAGKMHQNQNTSVSLNSRDGAVV